MQTLSPINNPDLHAFRGFRECKHSEKITFNVTHHFQKELFLIIVTMPKTTKDQVRLCENTVRVFPVTITLLITVEIFVSMNIFSSLRLADVGISMVMYIPIRFKITYES